MQAHPAASKPSYDHKISARFYSLFAVLALTLLLSAWFYPDPFYFWQHAFSDFGNLRSLQGRPNGISRAIFTLGMLGKSFIMLQVRADYGAGHDHFRNPLWKRHLALLGAAGFLVTVIPNDLHHGIHSIGVGAAVASLYFFTMTFYLELRTQVSPWFFWLNLAVLQIVTFGYAAAFFLEFASKQVFQKLCVFGIYYALLKVASALEGGFHPNELWGRFGQTSH
jgi:hypothetical protein